MTPSGVGEDETGFVVGIFVTVNREENIQGNSDDIRIGEL